MAIKEKITTRKVLIAEGILVLTALVYLIFSANTFSAPIAGKTIFDPDFVFEIGDGEELWISSDIEFTNPIIVNKETELNLPSGTYYWKIKGLLKESEVKTFTIENNLNINFNLERVEDSSNSIIENKGGITSSIENG